MKIPLEQIIITKDNPRQKFDEKGLRSLGVSIKQYGQLHPIIVRPKGDMYELVVGERRFRAHKLIGFETIEAQIRDVDDATAMEFRLIENIHREDLTDADKGDAVYSLLANYEKYKTIKDVAGGINVPYNTVLRDWCPKARKLSEKVKQLISSNQLKDWHTQYLLKYSHSVQNKLAEAIIKHKISSTKMSEFVKLYDADPKRNLEVIANEVLGVKKVKIDLSKLSSDARKEVEEIVEETKKDRKKIVLSDEERCIALTTKGKRCKQRRLPNKYYCTVHDPERERSFGRPKKPKNKKKIEPDEPFTPLPVLVDVEVKVITMHLNFPVPLWEKIAEYQIKQKPMMLEDAIIALLETHPALIEE